MIDPIVRPAGAADVAALAVLELEAREGLADVRGGARWLDTHAAIGGAWLDVIAERTVFVAVVTDDVPDARQVGRGVVVGYLVASLLSDPMPIVRIEAVYVTDEARELGFGDALVEATVAWALGVGAELIEADALPGDRNLKNLYERAGITARLITVSKRLQ